jgi:hypothetical protein
MAGRFHWLHSAILFCRTSSAGSVLLELSWNSSIPFVLMRDGNPPELLVDLLLARRDFLISKQIRRKTEGESKVVTRWLSLWCLVATVT